MGSQSPFRFAATLFSAKRPGALLPKIFQRSSVPVENIALGLADIGHSRGISQAWKRAFAVTAILPEKPQAPRPWGARLIIIRGNPLPAIRQHAMVGRAHLRTGQNVRQGAVA